MIRRRPKAQARFLHREPVAIPQLKGHDFQALKRIESGIPGKENDRKRLASMGLVSSKVASRCGLTELGRKALGKAIEKRELATNKQDKFKSGQ